MEKKRPDPDLLLLQAEKEEQQSTRGKLRIYLGAAPGVGKTYAMLEDAISRRKEGLDVIIGLVESHGRVEIENLMQGFEVLPKKIHAYRNQSLAEFDLDAALLRAPKLILLDEMAHTNVPGLRHEKRWQDIKEMLDQGIDVCTTLNVQHLESLNDVISQITGIKVHETVPDFILAQADSLELVDLSPEDLLQRLHEGKVYFPEQIELAKQNYFKKGNLIALRELALRVAAQYVNAKTFSYRQNQGISSIWPTKEKIMACIGHDAQASKIIRAAQRMANRIQSEWYVVYVDSPKLGSSQENRNAAVNHLRFAEKLGAQTRILTGINIVNTLMEFAREQNVTQIVVGKKLYPRWHTLFARNLTDEIIRKSQEIDVYVINEEQSHHIEPISTTKKMHPWKMYGFAVCAIGLSTLINFLLNPFLADSDLIMIYLLACTFVACYGRRDVATMASILSVLAYNFCFVPPVYSITVANSKYLVTLVIMLIVTQFISQLTVISRTQAEMARAAARNSSALYTLSHRLARTRGIPALLAVGDAYIAEAFDCKAFILLAKNGTIESSPDPHFTDKERSIAQWVYDLKQPAGFGTETLSFSKAMYLPLIASQGVIGVLQLYPKHPEHLYTPEEIRLLESFTNQIALAVEIDRLSMENV